jgi:hypothetical protein
MTLPRLWLEVFVFYCFTFPESLPRLGIERKESCCLNAYEHRRSLQAAKRKIGLGSAGLWHMLQYCSVTSVLERLEEFIF